MNDAVAFFQRPFPSANAVLLRGERPVLVDGGFGADVPALLAWLQAQGVPAEHLSLLVNTHFDCDHAGANHVLSGQFSIPIATHWAEAALVNARDAEACRARYLHQPVEPYRVDWAMEPGDVVDTGLAHWMVVETPGHTAGHLSLHAPALGLLVTGDAVHSNDLGWVDATRPDMLDAAEATMRRLAELRIGCALSGHGPPTTDPAAALAVAARRLAGWRSAPERMAWHGAKRVFAYALMVENGLDEAEITPLLLRSPWFVAYAAMPFCVDPADLVGPLMAEMLRSGAARWQGGRLVAGSPYTPPPPGWAWAPTEPTLWPM
ncbi:MBL fold metallo-hydrolase [Acidisphaera sp. L21]|uniref:MBL fold metallo-hydrolase n=1 Tax=Acidisphaera sp. L21 TaxID=1641851 RepID=UPI00131BC522|nr:MBL fold metallo-hydrolase [Acidisphaera sp. L21]